MSTLYYGCPLSPSDKAPVEEEMREKIAEYEANRLESVKNTVIAELLGVPQDKRHTESELGTAIIENSKNSLWSRGKDMHSSSVVRCTFCCNVYLWGMWGRLTGG